MLLSGRWIFNHQIQTREKKDMKYVMIPHHHQSVRDE
jgi:hypothetical protein